MIIYVDVDGVCAGLLPAWLARYNADYDDHLTVDDMKTWDISKVVKPECGVKIFEYIEDPTLYDTVEPIPDALEGVRMLREMGHRVVFCTSTPNGSAGAKLRWLRDHGFLTEGWKGSVNPDYVELHDKSLLAGDVLIDDGLHNVQAFRGLGILFRQPHNLAETWQVCADNWCAVVDLLRQEDLPIGNHPTEVRCPVQARAFRQLIDEMYRVHLEKNADYSPANILGTGMVGLATRLWDKTARLLNLMGFRITISESHYEAPKTPKNESIDDTLLDSAVYSVIGLLLRQGKWGH